jgi:hypothetical protein
MYTTITAQKSFRTEIILSAVLLLVVVSTILFGQALEQQGLSVRRWYWNNLLLVLPVVPLLLLQPAATLPPAGSIQQKKGGWTSTFLVGAVFGVLDVIVVKMILHPQPYTDLPPFLQPFPYSIFLYTSGALEVELFYRMMPLTVLLLLERWLWKGRYRQAVIAVLWIVTSLIEPAQQFPDGALWFIIYATLSGIGMNAWQFRSYLHYGFVGSLAVRLGHYFIWHILLGIYVQYVELA